MLVWEEVPIYWFDGESYGIQIEGGIAKRMLLEMVLRDYNGVSVIFLGF